jgi:hypothetical protein
MIFSHVLYQLSYLAQTKNPPVPLEARTGKATIRRVYRLLAPARNRGLHVSVTVQRAGFFKPYLLQSPTWEAPPQGGAYEP